MKNSVNIQNKIINFSECKRRAEAKKSANSAAISDREFLKMFRKLKRVQSKNLILGYLSGAIDTERMMGV